MVRIITRVQQELLPCFECIQLGRLGGSVSMLWLVKRRLQPVQFANCSSNSEFPCSLHESPISSADIMTLFAEWHLKVTLQLLFLIFMSSVLRFHSAWNESVILSNGIYILEVNSSTWRDPGCHFQCCFRSIQHNRDTNVSFSHPDACAR